jgi:4a-hydroxytetrahydrobiopterin dehydratase
MRAYDVVVQEQGLDARPRLERQQISDAVSALGWRYVLGVISTFVRVASLVEATDVATGVVAACGDGAEESLWIDIRPDRVALTLQSSATASVTPREIELADRISGVVRERGLTPDADIDASPRSPVPAAVSSRRAAYSPIG